MVAHAVFAAHAPRRALSISWSGTGSVVGPAEAAGTPMAAAAATEANTTEALRSCLDTITPLLDYMSK
jgi:hypothetical protein